MVKSSWLKVEVPGSIPGAIRFFWKVVGLDGDPLVRKTEKLLGRKSGGFGPQKSALASPAAEVAR
jgi:hypothetical protein